MARIYLFLISIYFVTNSYAMVTKSIIIAKAESMCKILEKHKVDARDRILKEKNLDSQVLIFTTDDTIELDTENPENQQKNVSIIQSDEYKVTHKLLKESLDKSFNGWIQKILQANNYEDEENNFFYTKSCTDAPPYIISLKYPAYGIFNHSSIELNKQKAILKIKRDDPAFGLFYAKQLIDAETNKKGEEEKVIQKLMLSKYFLINGDIVKSKTTLEEITDTNPEILVKKNYLLSIIYFLADKFDHSLGYILDLNKVNLSSRNDYCWAEIFTLMATKNNDLLKSQINNCLKSTEYNSTSEMYWAKQFFKNYLDSEKIIKEFGYFNKIPINEKYIEKWLKFSLYSNRTAEVLPNLEKLEVHILQNKNIRELIGHIYFREGEWDKAYEFTDDISTTNVENMKAEINIKKKNYELAFGNLRIAFEKKKNSINAYSRLIPVAYKLKKWEDLINFSQENVNYFTLNEKKLIRTTANIELENFKEADKFFKSFNKSQFKNFDYPTRISASYLELRNGNQDNLRNYSQINCEKLSGASCWMLFQTGIWENTIDLLKRDDSFKPKDEQVDQLSEIKDQLTINEPNLIDQKDIEEFDKNEKNQMLKNSY